MANVVSKNMMMDVIPTEKMNDVGDMINEERKKLYQAPIKFSSIKQYCQNWNRLLFHLVTKEANEGKQLEDKWWDNHEKVMTMVNDLRDKRFPDKLISVSSRRNYLSALIQIGQCNGISPDTIKIYNDNRASMNKDLVDKKKDEGTADLVTKEEIQVKVFDELEKGKFIWSCGLDKIHYYMLMKLHSAFNLRNDCASLHWITRQNYRGIGKATQVSKNWLIGFSAGRGKYRWEIELNDYKTKKANEGSVNYKCNKELNKLLNHYLNEVWVKHYTTSVPLSSMGLCNAVNINWMMRPVFVKGLNASNEMEALSSNDMTITLQKYNQMYLGKKIGTKMLRHSFYTEKYSGVAEELIKDAEQSLHSVGTAINHYTHVQIKPEDVTEENNPFNTSCGVSP
tara:strand:- start:3079 stop:4266 length:1188 start_codon:yes stop_codon:yes gene_type:complete